MRIGISLVILGSFLPWEQGGDFLPYRIYGIRLFPLVEDNGGVIVMLLASVVWLLPYLSTAKTYRESIAVGFSCIHTLVGILSFLRDKVVDTSF